MKKYTTHDINYMRENWEKLSTRKIAENIGHSYESVKVKANLIGLFRNRPCSMVKDVDADEEYMRKCREEYDEN